jgi:hypothetical protein
VYNQLKIARTSPKYEEIYGDGKGYVLGQYASSSNHMKVDRENAFLTGFIPC